jgi:hypothetical protein
VFAGVRVAVGVFSYLDRFSFGITADFDSFPDVEVIRTGIRAGFDELSAAADTATADGAKVTADTTADTSTQKPRKRASRSTRRKAPSS